MAAPDSAAEQALDDERFMMAALALGRRGLGRTAPNPAVAALVVRDGVVLGRGVTAPGGRPHAEPLALAEAGSGAEGATVYVTLEPCSHHGHTAPCAEALAEARVGRVVIAIEDPDPRVAGRGVAFLRQAGVEVVTGVCEAEARRAHLGHIHRVVEGRPALTLKLAQTQDGYAAAATMRQDGERLLITGSVANDWVHLQRSMHDAVLIGIGTALADDPRLTVRLPGMGQAQPVRVVLDTNASLSPSSRLVAGAGEAPLVLVAGPHPTEQAERLRRRGADILSVPVDPDGHLNLGSALRALAARGLTRIFCEGGPCLGGSLLRQDLVDTVIVLTGQDRLGVPGLPAFDHEARARLADPAVFRSADERSIGADRMHRFERIPSCSPA